MIRLLLDEGRRSLGELGQLVFTRGVNDKVADDEEFAKFVTQSLERYVQKDWGDLGGDDMRENDLAVKQGNRILAAYEHKTLPKVWIITESDRSVTTVLFPDEY